MHVALMLSAAASLVGLGAGAEASAGRSADLAAASGRTGSDACADGLQQLLGDIEAEAESWGSIAMHPSDQGHHP